jgi:hypothetical protein
MLYGPVSCMIHDDVGYRIPYSAAIPMGITGSRYPLGMSVISHTCVFRFLVLLP